MSLLNRGNVMVLETIGRRTGKSRFVPVGYWQEGEAYIVGGGAAGMATVPDWVKNLRSDSRAAVWIRRSKTEVLARELVGDDRDRAQEKATEIWPGVSRYERKSGRVIPYFRLITEQRWPTSC